jgi:hypothetical protein
VLDAHNSLKNKVHCLIFRFTVCQHSPYVEQLLLINKATSESLLTIEKTTGDGHSTACNFICDMPSPNCLVVGTNWLKVNIDVIAFNHHLPRLTKINLSTRIILGISIIGILN